MSKITLKNKLLAIFCFVGIQMYAQFTPGTYRLKNVLTGNYMEVVDLKSNDENSVYVKPFKDSDNSQIFTFIATGGEYNNLTRYNIESATGFGVLQANSTNIFVDNTQAPNTSNPRNFVVHELGANEDTGLPMYSFQAATSSGRFPSVDENTDPNNCNYLGGHSANKARWYLEQATVLSTEKVNISSWFISNPVTNELTISGLNKNVDRVDIYNVSGKRLISSKVDGASLKLDVTSLSHGLYFVEISGVHGSSTKKIVK